MDTWFGIVKDYQRVPDDGLDIGECWQVGCNEGYGGCVISDFGNKKWSSV